MAKYARWGVAKLFHGDYPRGVAEKITLLRKLIDMRNKYRMSLHRAKSLYGNVTIGQIRCYDAKDGRAEATMRVRICENINAKCAVNYY